MVFRYLTYSKCEMRFKIWIKLAPLMSAFYWLLKYISGSRTTVYGGLHGLQNNRSLTRLITERKAEIVLVSNANCWSTTEKC